MLLSVFLGSGTQMWYQLCSAVDWFVFSNIDEDEAFFQKMFLELSDNEARDYPRVYGGLESLTWS